MKYVIVLFALLLNGCANNVKKTDAIEGKEAYSISCNNNISGWAQCINDAVKACGDNDYEIEYVYGKMVKALNGRVVRRFDDNVHARTFVISCKKQGENQS